MKCYTLGIIFTLLLIEAIVICKAEDTEFVNPPDVKNHKNINLLPKDCGLELPGTVISAGTPPSSYGFRWAVLLAYGKNGKNSCVGTLINKRYILTTARCGSHKDLKIVRLGEYNLYLNISIETSIIHPDRNPPYKNDIALLRLSSDITFNDAVWPVCLPLAQTAISNPLTVVGWKETKNKSTSYVPLNAQIPYVNQKSCQDTYKNLSSSILIEIEICAGGAGYMYPCGNFDSPLISRNNIDNHVQLVQIGITSFGPLECGFYPDVYTNVALYIDWILDNLN